MSLTNYGENWFLSYLSSSGDKYISLHTTTPDEAGSGAEVSGGSYARMKIPFGTPLDGTIQNTAEIQFPTATEAWGTVVGFGVFDAATGGNMVWYGQIVNDQGQPAPRSVSEGDIFHLPTGNFKLTID